VGKVRVLRRLEGPGFDMLIVGECFNMEGTV